MSDLLIDPGYIALVDFFGYFLFEGQEPETKANFVTHLRPGFVFDDIDKPNAHSANTR